jgi:hypothetical protein
MLLNFLAKERTSMKKDELFKLVKSGKITINNARESLGLEKVDHPLMNTTKTNAELLAGGSKQ